MTTVEGVAGTGGDEGRLHRVQQAFVDTFAVQCGYCIPGFIVSTAALLDEADLAGGEPLSRDEIELALSGNLCRCTGYYAILQAVGAAAANPSSGAT